MRPLLFLLFVFGTNLSYSQYYNDSVNTWLDTCTSPYSTVRTALKISRANIRETPQLSRVALNTALEELEENDSSNIADVILEQGIFHAIRMNQDSAIPFYERSIEYTPKEDSIGIGYCYRNLCAAHREQERFNQALENGYYALRWLPNSDSVFRPLTYLEMSKIYYALRNYKLGVEYADKGIPYFQEKDDYYNLSATYTTKGLCLLSMDSTYTPQSIAVLHQARVNNSYNNNPYENGTAKINLGIAHLENHNFDSAFYYLFGADSTFQEIGYPNPTVKPTIYVNLASAFIDVDNYDEAEKYANQAYEMTSSGASDFVFQEACFNMYQINKKKGNYEVALKYLEENLKTFTRRTRILNDATLRMKEQEADQKYYMNQLRLQRQKDQIAILQNEKEQRILTIGLVLLLLSKITLITVIILLRRRKRIAQENLRQLNTIDQHKNQLFSIIGHDLRGPIGNSLFLLKLLPQDGDRLSTDTSEIVQNVRMGLTEVQELLENLLVWAKQQGAGLHVKKQSVTIKPIVAQTKQIMTPLIPTRGMKLEVEVADELSWELDPNMYSTILRNVVANALKYAPESSTVKIVLEKENGKLVTRIIDSGPGIPEQTINHLQKEEYDPESKRGLGLFLVQSLVHELGGQLRFEKSDANSAVVIVLD